MYLAIFAKNRFGRRFRIKNLLWNTSFSVFYIIPQKYIRERKWCSDRVESLARNLKGITVAIVNYLSILVEEI